MLLFHATDEAGRRGIEAEGFAVSHQKDSPGAAYLSDARDDPQLASRDGCWVIVDLPDEVAQEYLYTFDDGTVYEGVYRVPWNVLNAYRPFTYEHAEDPA